MIAVGHYIGVKPQYAEAALDEAISEPLPTPTAGAPDEGWILTQLTMRGTITGGLGQPFLLPDPRSPADRLIAVVGIGLPGRLGAGELTVAVRELCWAVGRLGRAHLASVLIGSGAGNLSEQDAAEAWANGIAQALAGQDKRTPRLAPRHHRRVERGARGGDRSRAGANRGADGARSRSSSSPTNPRRRPARTVPSAKRRQAAARDKEQPPATSPADSYRLA